MVKDLSLGVVVALSLFTVLTVASTVRKPAGDATAFRAFLPAFEAGLSAFVNGDAGPWMRHVSRSPQASILGGFGGYEIGAQVEGRYGWAASQFEPSGAAVRVDYLTTVVEGDLAYTVTIERSHARIRGRAAPAPMALRVTQVFRREDGEWKLLHRHADHDVTRPPR